MTDMTDTADTADMAVEWLRGALFRRGAVRRALAAWVGAAAAVAVLAGCSGGSDGAAGTNGTNGTNGMNGTNGTNGRNSLIVQTAEPAGANCPAGGTRISAGLDANGNGQLDSG